MKHRSFFSGLAALVTGTTALGGVSMPEHFDTWLRVENNRVVTGAIGEGSPGQPIAEHWRVFGAEIGEDPAFPYSAFEPGFQTLASPFTAGAIWNFRVLDTLGQWNGDGFDAGSATMTIAFGLVEITTGNGGVEGFSFASDADGVLHDHFDFTLNGPGNGIPERGIYLLPLTIRGISPMYAESEPFWFVFNFGMDEREHEMAIEWVQDNLVPAPGALALLAAAGFGAGSRRRR